MPKDTEEREDKPRFQIVDRRVLTEEDRKGTSAPVANSDAPLIEVPGQTQAAANESERPKLEIIGGGNPNSGSSGQSALGSSSLDEAPGQAVSAPSAAGDAADATETVPAGDMDGHGRDADVRRRSPSRCARNSKPSSSPRWNRRSVVRSPTLKKIRCAK